jgi:hypothetical protein
VTDAIPDHVKAFIAEHIDSVEMLDVLLFLRRNRNREWTPEEIAQRLYTSPKSAANRLSALQASRVLAASETSEPPGYR